MKTPLSSESSRRPQSAIVGPLCVIALAPALIVVAFQLPLINQLDYADAWFYSAYAWAPRHHLTVFPLNYYAVRFPAILSIALFERAFGTDAGYVVLRYLLAVAAAFSIYLASRRFASRWVALAAALLLYLNPYFSRMLLWDYSFFIAVAAGVAGFALWWWSERRGVVWSALPGAALALALFAHPSVVLGIVVLFLADAVSAARLGTAQLERLARRFAVAGISGLLVFLVGFAAYRAFIPLTPEDLIRPTIDFFRNNKANAVLYQRPASEWLFHEPRIWPPLVVLVGLVSVLRSRLLGTDTLARVAQVCVGYTAFLWLYRFTVTSWTIETWWYYSLVVIVVAPGLAVLLHSMARDSGEERLYALIAVSCAFVTGVLVRAMSGLATDWYDAVERHPALVFTILSLGVIAALLLAAPQGAVRTASLGAFVTIVALMSWAPSIFDDRGTTGIFVTDGGTEWSAYPAARQFLDTIRAYDGRGSRVYTWYPGIIGLTNIGWTTLPQDGHTVQELQVDTPLTRLEPLGRARLLQPDAAYVLVMSTHPRDLPAARRALSSAGFGGPTLRRASLAGGRLRYFLMRLTTKPRS
jgi:hypothetical protein